MKPNFTIKENAIIAGFNLLATFFTRRFLRGMTPQREKRSSSDPDESKYDPENKRNTCFRGCVKFC